MMDVSVCYSAHPDPLEAVARFSSRGATVPFAPDTLDLLERLSKRLLRSTETRDYPELQAFGFSIRKTAIESWSRGFRELTAQALRVPRGCVLHIAPANVPTVMGFSWMWSTLLGNHNVIRLSERRSAAARLLEQAMFEELRHSAAPLSHGTVALSYPHHASTTARLSAAADVRMIWGGTEAIRAVRSVPAQPQTVDLAFVDRVSACLLSAAYVAGLDEQALGGLASNLAVDIATFDQAACSSPRFAVWVGAPSETEAASTRLWRAVDAELARRGFHVDTPAALGKMTDAAVLAATGAVSSSFFPSNRLTVARGGVAAVDGSSAATGWGFVREFTVPSLSDVARVLSPRVQTIVAAGWTRPELTAFVSAPGLTGVERIVGPGEALAFGRWWDGFDLLCELTRAIPISDQACRAHS